MESDQNDAAHLVNAGQQQADESDSTGNVMTRKLKDADRAAVDMLFDRITAAQSNGDGMVAMISAVNDANLQAVEKVLNVLSGMPAPEPPADLATRTLQLVARATGTAIPAMPGTFASDQPHA